jgi:hypothetical protein
LRDPEHQGQALPYALIQRSAWKVNPRKFVGRSAGLAYEDSPSGRCARYRVLAIVGVRRTVVLPILPDGPSLVLCEVVPVFVHASARGHLSGLL